MCHQTLITLLLMPAVACLIQADYPPVYPSNKDRKVAFACQNSYIHLSCKEPGEKIRILLANYGRFSLVVCNQDGVHKGWNVQCTSKDSMRVVTERCDNQRNCTFQASNELFGDPCPETKKYIEVRYYCEKANDGKETDPPYVVNPTTTLEPTTVAKVTSSEGHASTSTQGHKDGKTEKWKTEKYCEQIDSSGILWERTFAGERSYVQCPEGTLGNAWWHCGKNGRWVGEPDLSDCVSLWLLEVDDMISKDVPAGETVAVFNRKMKGKKLSPGDLKRASGKVIPGLVDKVTKELQLEMPGPTRKEKAHSFTKELVKSGSDMLNSTQRSSWKDLLPEERRKSATSLIVSLEQMALEVAATMDRPETVSSAEQNIVMEVSVIKMSARSRSRDDLKLPIMQYEQSITESFHGFSLPLDAVSGLTAQDDVTVTYLFYNNMEELLDPNNDNTLKVSNSSYTMNSNVIAASVMKHSTTATRPHGRTQLKRPMTFRLSHKNSLDDKVAVCAYWKYDESSLYGEWSQDGCRVLDSTDEYTTCECDHLTNFAVLMDVTGTKLSRAHMMSLQAITYVGCIVSIVCLFMCFISFSIFRNLQSDRNTIHKNLVLCLMIAELLFLFGIGQTQEKVLCAVIAGSLHFFFLTSFSWMCLEGIQLYFMLIEVFEAERSRVRWFYAFGYGVPALIVGISAAIDHTGYGTDSHCWLRTDNYFVLSFVIPAAVVVLINIVMLSIAIYMMCRHAGVTASSIQARQKGKLEKIGNGKGDSGSEMETALDLPTWLKGSTVLVVLLGLTWIFGFLYINEDLVAIAYIFTILNSLQGLFIFIFHCFMDRKVKKEWRRAVYKARWLPMCCRVNIGGYNASFSSPGSSSSGPQNYFLKFWSSRKRKRSSTSTLNTKNRRSDLESFLRSDVSSGTTTGTGVNRYSNQSDKLLPNGQNIYTAMPTHYEGAVVGDLSVVDASVIDSEYVTEYCQHNLQVSNEKKQFHSDTDDSDSDGQMERQSCDSITKFLGAESQQKLNVDFSSENEDGQISYAVLENGEKRNCLSGKQSTHSENERNVLNDILSLYQNTRGANELHPGCITGDKTDFRQRDAKNSCRSVTKSAPDLKYPTQSTDSEISDLSTHPLLGSLPDLSTIGEEEGEKEACCKSVSIEVNTEES